LTVGGGQKLLTAIVGGQPPDVVFFDRFQIASWADQEVLTDLTNHVKDSGMNTDLFYKAAWNEVVYEERIYGIPVTTDARVLFYNKDHFSEAGLDPNHPPATIAELEEFAAKLMLKEGQRYKRLGFVPWLGQGSFYTWGWAFGGDFYDSRTKQVTANEPKLVAAMKWLQDYSEQYADQKINALTGSEAVDPFLTGQVSMEIGNNLLVANLKANNPALHYGIAPIPTPDGKEATTWSGGYSVVIPKGAEHPDEAWELIQYFAGDEAQERIGKAYLSAIPEVNERIFKNDPMNMEIMSLLDNAHWRPVIPQGQLLWNELAHAVDLAINGKDTPERLLNEVTARVNAALDKVQGNER
jgi:multiple sugar transport system substrate-binding protein